MPDRTVSGLGGTDWPEGLSVDEFDSTARTAPVGSVPCLTPLFPAADLDRGGEVFVGLAQEEVTAHGADGWEGNLGADRLQNYPIALPGDASGRRLLHIGFHRVEDVEEVVALSRLGR